MKKTLLILSIFLLGKTYSQITVAPTQDYHICDLDGDGLVTIPFSEFQNYALDILSQFDESPEIYVSKAHRGIEKITNLYNNPQIMPVCGDVDGEGGYYDIAFNSQKELYIARRYGLLQKWNIENCTYENIGQIHPNGQSVLALSFDHQDYLYEGGWTSKVYRANPENLGQFYLWHDFGIGNASGDFVQIGDFLYIAWTMPDGKDHLFKVTLGPNNEYVSHVDLGQIKTGTFGLAAEYGRLYGNTVDLLYEIDLNTLQMTDIKQNTSSGSAFNWWGAAGYHEGQHIEISYHDTMSEAETGSNPLNDPYQNQIPFQDDFIYIRIHESTQHITYIIPIHIFITIPPAAANTNLKECRNLETGTASFTLNDAEIQINPNSGLNFSYFNNLQDLATNTNQLPSTIVIAENKSIYVKVKDDAENCYGVAKLDLIIREANVNYNQHVAFCYGTSVVLSVPDEFIAYQWNGIQDADADQPLNSNEVSVTLPGEYSVTVISTDGCTYVLPFEVVLGGAPIITDVMLNSDNSIVVSVSPPGDYEYSLDNIFWQNSPVFYNITEQDYNIYVRDMEGCRSDVYKFAYFKIPNFISPNGDGINDFWEIRGMAQYPEAEIKIFDRYGKIFMHRKINGQDKVWNGKYMGNPVPSGTYWYILTFSTEHRVIGNITVRN